jgi:hypothetical protein
LQRLRDECVFYLDENLCNCKPIQEVFEHAEIKYERHLAHFPRATPDPEWLGFVGQRSWIVITKDKAQRYNPLEKTEFQTYRIKQFAFHSGNLSGLEMAKILRDNLRKIFNLIEKQPPPFIATLTKSGVTAKALVSR